MTTQDAAGTRTVIPSLSGGSYSANTDNINGNSNSSISSRIQGPLTATFHWVADAAHPNSPPPAQATVTENCNFSWKLRDSNGSVSGSYNTDLGQSGSIAANTTSSGGGSKTFSVSTGGLSSFSVSCNPQASIGGSTGSGVLGDEFSILFTASAINNQATINLDGYKTVNGMLQAMAGQQIKATLLIDLPTGAKITSYTWSFDGGTFSNPIKNWNGNGTAPNGTPQQLFPFTSADLTGTDTTGNGITVNPLNFYDQTTDTITVKCAVGLKLSDGTTKTVPAQSLPITFLKPTSVWGIKSGIVRSPQGVTGLFGVPGDKVYTDGQSWHDVVINAPSLFPGGQFSFVQTVKPILTVYRELSQGSTASAFYKQTNSGIDGLDTIFLTTLHTLFPISQ